MSTIESKEQAVAVAHQVIARVREVNTLVKKLQDEDMLGLECAETVQLERLSAKNAAAALVLAEWIVKEHNQ